ncbi:MAG: leucine-rich repeat domain-containing protein [Clostridiales bacterium]|nr:leucine-rich repeat domain-containing protein [Clostridiales bacterium]
MDVCYELQSCSRSETMFRRSIWFKFVLSTVMLCVLFFTAAAQADVLTLPKDTRYIRERAFCYDTSLDKVVLPEGLREIGSLAFGYSSVTSVVFPASVTSIADDAFKGSDLAKVTAPSGSYAYAWCVDHGYIADNEVKLFCAKTKDDYGDVLEGIFLGVFDADGKRLASKLVNSWRPGHLENGGVSGATVWKLGGDLYYVEAMGGFEVVCADYVVYRANASSITLVVGASDPGYTEGTILVDMKTNKPLYYDEYSGPDESLQEMIDALSDHFSDYGFDYGSRTLDLGGHFGTTDYISAGLSNSTRADEIIGWDKSRVLTIG